MRVSDRSPKGRDARALPPTSRAARSRSDESAARALSAGDAQIILSSAAQSRFPKRLSLNHAFPFLHQNRAPPAHLVEALKQARCRTWSLRCRPQEALQAPRHPHPAPGPLDLHPSRQVPPHRPAPAQARRRNWLYLPLAEELLRACPLICAPVSEDARK